MRIADIGLPAINCPIFVKKAGIPELFLNNGFWPGAMVAVIRPMAVLPPEVVVITLPFPSKVALAIPKMNFWSLAASAIRPNKMKWLSNHGCITSRLGSPSGIITTTSHKDLLVWYV